MSFGAGCEMYRFEDTGPVSLRGLLPYKCWNLVFRELRNSAGMATGPAGSARAEADGSELYAQSVRAAADGDLSGSLARLSASIARAPANWRLHQMRGVVWALKGDLNSAVVDVSEAIRLNGSDLLSYRLRSSIYRAMKEWEKSAADTDMLIQLGKQQLQVTEEKLQDSVEKEGRLGSGL